MPPAAGAVLRDETGPLPHGRGSDKAFHTRSKVDAVVALPLYYNWRNLLVRKVSTALTFFVVAVVVCVLSVLLSFAAGIRASLAASGSPDNLIVLANGATSESTSIILRDEVTRLMQTPGVARDSSGTLLLSQELSAQTQVPRKGPDGIVANVPVRGVDEVAFSVHSAVRIVEGRRFQSGSLEVIVGKAALARYTGLQVGDEITLGRSGNRQFAIVGIFEAGGGALESEIWAPRTILADVYKRRLISNVLMRMDKGASVDDAIQFIKGPSVGLQVKTEPEYYEELSSKTREIVVLTTVLVGIMAAGAVFAVANTMYAAVDGRRREIAMLRTLGFNRRSIVAAFLVESLLICTAGCLVGLGASMLLDGRQQDYLSDTTWTVLAYELRVTPGIFAMALGLGTFVGVAGALAPAVRAARSSIIEALRKA